MKPQSMGHQHKKTRWFARAAGVWSRSGLPVVQERLEALAPALARVQEKVPFPLHHLRRLRIRK